MSVRRYGEGGTEIAYLHGLGEAGGIFDSLLRGRALRKTDTTHVIPDLVGYGRSAWPADPLGLEEMADQLAAWLGTFVSPPLVVGHSMGGVLSVLIAERAPAAVKAILNIEGNISIGDCTFSRQVATWSEADYVERGHQDMADHIYETGLAGGPARYFHAAFRFADPASTHRHSRDLVEISASESMANRMAGLQVPATFIAGVPNGLADRSLELLDAAGVSTVRVEPAGHWAYVDQPDVCAELVASLA